ncbi:MAG: peptidase M19 [Anaerolineae bacterium]|nr:peptidase M19 [Anaerolineae bacterium]
MKPFPNILVDAHLDIAYNRLAHGRDFRLAALVKRRQEAIRPNQRAGIPTVGLPDLLLARVGVVFGTLFTAPPLGRFANPNISYETPQQAYRQALRQMDYYQRLADEDPRVCLVRTRAELAAVLASWEPGRELHEHQLGIVLLMEGADPVLEPRQLEEWVERGVRIVGPAWRATRYAAGTGAPGTFTKLGEALLEVMAHFGIILDCSHLAERAFFQAVDRYPGAIIASHSNPARFAEGDRHLTDAMLQALFERDGVVGLVLYNEFMLNGWKRWRDRKQDVPLGVAVDMIDHVCQLAGDALHVGIGTDWDGGFGWEATPDPLDTHLDLWALEERLLARNFSPQDVRNILHGNFLRKLSEGLPG